MNIFVESRLWLEGINPAAPFLSLTLCSWLATYAVRKYCPALWSALLRWGPPGGWLENTLQTLPSVLASAALGALGAGDDPWSAAKGAASGMLAPLIHHLVKASPAPYRGALGVPLDGPTSRRVIADAVVNAVGKGPDV
jgi:hypothetical protein